MKYLFFILSFFIFLGLVFFYFEISKPQIELKPTNTQKSIKSEDNSFKIKKVEVSNLPVRVLYIKIDFKKQKYKVVYKITLDNIDKFALFNVKAILDNSNIVYSMIKGRNSKIYIFFKDLQQANYILNLFKEYNFKIKIEKLVKRI